MEQLSKSRDEWYQESYDDFINYFKGKKKLCRRDIVLGIAMAHSWMPRIPRTPVISKTVVNLVNDLSKTFDKQNIQDLKIIINNSIVGTSKLLHFVNPNLYPIWDSKVCEVFSDKVKEKYSVDKIDSYLDYKKYCDSTILDKNKFSDIIKQVGNHGSKYRTIDKYMWGVGENKQH